MRRLCGNGHRRGGRAPETVPGLGGAVCARGQAVGRRRRAPESPISRSTLRRIAKTGPRRLLQGADRGAARRRDEARQGLHHRAGSRPATSRNGATPDRRFTYRGHDDPGHAAAVVGRRHAGADRRAAPRHYDLAALGWHSARVGASDGRDHAPRLRRAQRGARRSRPREDPDQARAARRRRLPRRCAARYRQTTPPRRPRCRADRRGPRAARRRTSPWSTTRATPWRSPPPSTAGTARP